MKKINVSTHRYPGRFAIVDDADFERLLKHKWSIRLEDKKYFYAVRSVTLNGKSKSLRMHRVLMQPQKGFYVDHRDGNGLNNQRENLRVCTNSQNQMNRKIGINNKSGYKGVYWHKPSNKWASQIKHNGKFFDLGRYFCIIKAAKAYDEAAKKLFGEFAKPNFKT